jgi:ribonucleoside-triphosphate reductase
VREPVDAFTKLKFEAQFQKISSGGSISYIEVPNMQNNIEALETMIKFIYENIQYAEFNTKSDYCHVCEFGGEIQINEEG